ncbi:MAG TPA: 30S ribosomal protein S6 [Actinomycetota bacterium]|nr:30S ribosomal protein S6 [Actinomycetota bacterium]
MRDYEVMVIVDGALEEGDIQKAVERVSTVISEAGGEVVKVDRWGNRRFAYEIDHKYEGYYFVVDFKAEEPTVEQLKRVLQISDEYIRGKILRPQTARQKENVSA